MKELMRKALLLGVGAVTMPEDKLRALVEELIAQGQVSKEEGERTVKDVLAKADAARQEWEGRVRDLVRDGMRKIDLVPRQDYDALLARVAALEEKAKAAEAPPPQ